MGARSCWESISVCGLWVDTTVSSMGRSDQILSATRPLYVLLRDAPARNADTLATHTSRTPCTASYCAGRQYAVGIGLRQRTQDPQLQRGHCHLINPVRTVPTAGTPGAQQQGAAWPPLCTGSARRYGHHALSCACTAGMQGCVAHAGGRTEAWARGWAGSTNLTQAKPKATRTDATMKCRVHRQDPCRGAPPPRQLCCPRSELR
jgi:hypothetical protein